MVYIYKKEVKLAKVLVVVVVLRCVVRHLLQLPCTIDFTELKKLCNS